VLAVKSNFIVVKVYDAICIEYLTGKVSLNMPKIARVYGIVIKMYFREHGVPHLHAIYSEYNGVF